jgi:DNA-binding transcriptional LysR family regulator|tara:strand:+ start:50189 stop:51058 length:870 start_codon:yes stop_codon:yes gene_type:complete
MSRLAFYHFETLLWIARLGTFRAAAERLNTTQSTISARVREIEDQLAFKIFQRKGRGVVFTIRGRQLVHESEHLITAFNQTLFGARNSEAFRGIVNIGAGEIAAANCLPDYVINVKQAFPLITLKIEIDLTARMLHKLLAAKYDLVFVAGPVINTEIRTTAIGGVDLLWLAVPGAIDQVDTKNDLQIWSVGQHSPIYGIMERSLAEQGIPNPLINICNNVQALIEIIAKGAGAALLPATMVQDQISDGSLVQILEQPKESIEFQACIRSSERDTMVLQLFKRAGDFLLS